MRLFFLSSAISIPIIKNKYVVFPVVKKLPVLLTGNISTINKNIKEVIKWLSFRGEL